MHRPIGLFDSGFGGLTVMREVIRLLPHEDLIYLGDTAHLPYGNKSPQTVTQFALQNSAFLLTKNIKLLIIACHTACTHALSRLQQELPIPVLGVIQPGLSLAKNIERLAILGTTSTIESGLYQSLLSQQNPHITLYPQACPLFVPLVEEGFLDHPSALSIAQSYLAPLKGKIDAALLACTHYPLLRPVLQQVLGPSVQLLEPAPQCAQQAKAHLTTAHLLNPQTQPPRYQFYATDSPAKFHQWGPLFLDRPIPHVQLTTQLP
jgi:glutamate racemase